ncbi:hypothetical protein AVEN_232489-1, partial [Araneus ventricosus]
MNRRKNAMDSNLSLCFRPALFKNWQTDVHFSNELLSATGLTAFLGFYKAKRRCGPFSSESPPGRQPAPMYW